MSSRSVPHRADRGEVFAVAGCRDAAVVWAGGLHSGRNARMRAEWGSARQVSGRSLHLVKCSLWWKKCSVAIQAPSLGRERPLVVVARRLIYPGGGVFYPRGPSTPSLVGDLTLGDIPSVVLLRGGTDSSWRGVSSARWRWGGCGGGLPARRPAGPVAGGMVCPLGVVVSFLPVVDSWRPGHPRSSGDDANGRCGRVR